MKSQKLYELLKNIPKGALHHDHFECNQDKEFLLKHVITDNRIYLSADKSTFQIGTVQ